MQELVKVGDISVETGGSYIVVMVKGAGNTGNVSAPVLHTLTVSNSVHMFWLLPQYVLMTIGEVMFSITVMDFSYSEVKTRFFY